MSDPDVRRAGALRVSGLTARYGSFPAVRDITLHVEPGETVALLGPNGAGKTSVLRAITGLVAATGSVRLGTEEMIRRRTDQIVRAGIAHVPEGRQLFPHSTGFENVRIGTYSRGDRAQAAEDVERYFAEWPIAAKVRDRPGALMSGGEQQVIALGRALMSAPRFLLLDEPSQGLAPIAITQLYAALGDLIAQASGLGVLIVEQNIAKALELADRCYVIVNGQIVAEHTADVEPEQVLEYYRH